MVNPHCLQGKDFLNKFINDYTALEDMGFSRAAILKMLGSLNYVVDFSETPEWLEAVDKLPKGCRWADGRKFKAEAVKGRSMGETYTFLAVGDDLYLKDVLDNGTVVAYNDENHEPHPRNNQEGTWELAFYHVINHQICLIRDWKRLDAAQVANGLQAIMSPTLRTAIFKFWHEHGVPLGGSVAGRISYERLITPKEMEAVT